MSSNSHLPDVSSPDIQLVNTTEKENHEILLVNSTEWKGALNLDQYLAREQNLSDQDFTRDGGLSSWALVHGEGESRLVLCSCETIRKTALVTKNGKVEQAVAHGVASVFCAPEYRGKGYAGQMIKLLGERLRTWQSDKGNVLFSVLYSDIGKKFYTARGWRPFPSTHISLPPTQSRPSSLPATQPLGLEDIATYCAADAQLLEKRLEHLASTKRTPVVAVLPNAATVAWHHARETHVSKSLRSSSPSIRGALVQDEQTGYRTWAYFSRFWNNSDPNATKDNSLHLLRLAVEDPDYEAFAYASPSSSSSSEAETKAKPEIVKAIAAILAVAQREAQEWGMEDVQVWNPTTATVAAANLLAGGKEVEVTDRQNDSICSLRWYGDSADVDSVEWVGNEKYGWC